jgi:uncharacterized protein YndB with AHSA1/START domain
MSTGKLQVATHGDREIVMTRTFSAPRHLVFEAFTKPDLIRRWLTGPPGWSMTVCEFEARVGGSYRYVWRNQDGTEMGMGGVVKELTPPERIVATEKFDQAWYEGEAIGTIELSELAGQTMLRQTLRYNSRETRDAVLKTPMEQGVGYGYDQLEALVTAQTAGMHRAAGPA